MNNPANYPSDEFDGVTEPTQDEMVPVVFLKRSDVESLASPSDELSRFQPASGAQAAPPVFPFPTWGIAGIDAVQATQFFKLNNQGSGIGANNSVPMIARKDLILRVYPKRGFFLNPGTVTGSVTRPGKPALSPLNGPVTVQNVSALQQINLNHSLNFRVPAADCVGTVTFTIRIVNTANPAAFKTQNITLTFQEVPQVRVHGVLIHYTGLGMNLANPSGLDLIDTLKYITQAYPIRGITYTACEVLTFSGDLRVGGGGGCGTGWNQLFNTIWNMRAASGTTDVFIGLLPPGVPTSGVIGCGGGGVAIAYKGGGAVLAQEVGHAFGRAHAPCGNPGGPDPSYPVYGTYPSGSIGEFGMDTSTMTIFNPASTYDFMSYCGPTWVSPYTYTGLKNAITASPAAMHAARAGSRQQDKAGEYLFLNFRVHKSGRVELLNSFHATSANPPEELGRPTGVGCTLIDRNGQAIKGHHCLVNNPHMEDDDAYIDYHEAVLLDGVDIADVHAIDFTNDGKAGQLINFQGVAPVVTIKETKRVDKKPNLMRVEWEADKSAKTADPVHYILRYSSDNGSTWRAVAADLTTTSHVVDLDMLAGGDKCVFQVIASAGIRSSTATTPPMKLARKPRQPYILQPEAAKLTIKAGEELVLLGGGFSPEFESTDFDDVTWSSNKDGVLGIGYQVITRSLSVGHHTISLSFPDGLGGTASGKLDVTVR